jgi:hypothetical protein
MTLHQAAFVSKSFGTVVMLRGTIKIKDSEKVMKELNFNPFIDTIPLQPHIQHTFPYYCKIEIKIFKVADFTLSLRKIVPPLLLIPAGTH